MKKVQRRSLNSVEDYKKTSAINSMKLVRLVRSHEVLYNSYADGYTDKNYKDQIWERIIQTLFPNYHTLDSSLKEVILTNVRTRWKTLRNAIAREIKKSATIENYCRKKESPIISELEFLIPHIKSIYGTKFTEELDLRERDEYIHRNDTDEIYEDVFDDLIDLTDEIDMKPIMKTDAAEFDDFDRNSNSPDNNISTDVFYPTIQMSVAADSTATEQQNNEISSATTSWNCKEYCSVAEYKEGEFTNSTVLCPEPDCKDDSPTAGLTNAEEAGKQANVLANDTRKRARIDLEEPAELQTKILHLLSNLERRERNDQRQDQEAHDEDRMFLLSLVSDLKRVPAAKKMLVKADIAMTIAKSMQP